MRSAPFVIGTAILCSAASAQAQRTTENAVTAAQDAFGVSVGAEKIGLYDDREVRGFSPVTAGNVRVEGIYIDLQGRLNSRLVEGNTIRIGISALGYPFPAPTGIVDYKLRLGSGEPSLSAAVQAGTFGARALEIDGFLPLSGEELTVSGGAALRASADGPRNVNRIFQFAITPQWTPDTGIQITPFWSYSHNREDQPPTVFTAGAFLPPALRNETFGQRWVDQDRIQENVGLLSRFDLSDELTLRAGLFRSSQVLLESYSEVYRNASPSGLADHAVSSAPRQSRGSTSGEARLTWRKSTGRVIHTIHLMARGRSGTSLYGGSSSVPLGPAVVGVFDPLPQPDFAFAKQSRDAVKQLTGGLGYEGTLPAVGQIVFGIQKSAYRKRVTKPGRAAVGIANYPWLYNAGGALNLTPRLTVYGSYARGMEENGTAPDAAANRGEPLPSALTSQREVGFRYALRKDFRIVAGAFDLRKPYFSLDSRNIFTQLGSLSTRGVEISLAGPVLPGLNIVAGAVLMEPRVRGEAVELGHIGQRAVAQTRRLIRLNADYRLPFWSNFSVDVGIVHAGRVTAGIRPDPSTGQQFAVPARTTVDLGTRYRFQLANAPAVLRLQVTNLADVRGWEATSSGGFQRNNPRQFLAQVSADF